MLGSVRPVGVGIDKTVSALFIIERYQRYEFRYFKCSALELLHYDPLSLRRKKLNLFPHKSNTHCQGLCPFQRNSGNNNITQRGCQPHNNSNMISSDIIKLRYCQHGERRKTKNSFGFLGRLEKAVKKH